MAMRWPRRTSTSASGSWKSCVMGRTVALGYWPARPVVPGTTGWTSRPAWPMAACPWSPLTSRVDVVHGDGPGLVVAVVAVDGGAVVGAEVAEVRRVWLSLPHAGRTTAIASATASFHTLNCLPRSTRDTPLPYHRMSD